MVGATVGMDWVAWLKDAGIIREEDAVTHVVIDIDIQKEELVTIYVERLDSGRLLKVTPPSVESAKIEVV